MDRTQDDRLESTRVDKGILNVSIHAEKELLNKSNNGNFDNKPLMLSSHGGALASSTADTDKNEYTTYTFPENPNIFDYILFVPVAVMHSLRNMSRAFGWRFVAMIIIVYGLQVRAVCYFHVVPVQLIDMILFFVYSKEWGTHSSSLRGITILRTLRN